MIKKSKILFCLLLLFLISCQDNDETIISDPDPTSTSGVEAWQDLVSELVLDHTIIVQKNHSIQDAINAAEPGNAIYIEPGIYKESLTIDKPDILLIGIQSVNGDKVILENPGGASKGINVTNNVSGVEISNIELQNFADNTSYTTSNSAVRTAGETHVIKMSREWACSAIAYYQFEIQIGSDPHNVVRIRRFVKEDTPYQPLPTNGDIFMAHGANQNLEIFFRTGTDLPTPQTSAFLYLASKGIDVWGIDQAWTLVPQETTEFEFMKDWGVEHDAKNTLAALAFARLIRGFTGQGYGPMNLLGFSYGTAVAFTAAGMETQQEQILRDIKGLINTDQILKFDDKDEMYRQNTCMGTTGLLEQINAGIYQAGNAGNLGNVGQLAHSAPDEPSPIFPGLTNAQAAFFIGANMYLLGDTPAPYWHFTGGNQTSPEMPATDLLFTSTGRWLKPLPNVSGVSYMPNLAIYDLNACMCDEEDVSFDDHFSKISLPIFYLGAEGGFGSYGLYTNSITASSDITSHIVSKTPERFNDFGHADLFYADSAPEDVWEPLYQWLREHNDDVMGL